MERQALLGLALCSLALFAYYLIVLPWLFPPKERPTRQEEVKPQRPLAKIEKKETRPLPQTGAELVENLVLENDLLKITLTNEGAALKSAILKKYKDYKGGENLCLITPSDPPGADSSPLAIEEMLGKYDLSRHRFQVKEVSPHRVGFQTLLEGKLILTKYVSLEEGRYHLDVEIILENTTEDELPLKYNIISSSQICPEGTPQYDMASVVGVKVGAEGTKLIQKTLQELVKSPERNESHGIAWAGGVNKYFANILMADSCEWVSAVDSKPVIERNSQEKANLLVSMETAGLTLPPKGVERHHYQFFIGPKREDILKEYKLEKLLGFGAFTPISKALLKVLKAFYNIVPNYGVDIIMLTFIVKVVLFPLTRKSQMSMYKMQKLQPMIEQLKEKHKKDKQRMGQEQMALFKKHGVNPMSGCLPLILQMPIFYALFRTLQLSFEMRQAPFALWIKDLSQPDTFFILPFFIPFLGNTLNVLPIIMTVASVYQMRMMPKSADPAAQQQQRLMKFMPVLFAFILYHMPSGLVLYWTVNTFLSIGEQLLIKRSLAKIQ